MEPTEELIDEIYNDITRGNRATEIKVSDQGKILSQFVNIGADVLDGFDDWLVNKLHEQVKSRMITMKNNRTIRFTRVKVVNPTISADSKTALMPRDTRERDMIYWAPIYGTLEMRDEQGECIGTVDKVLICYFPVMLRSRACNLYGMSPEQLDNVGEDPTDPFCYFIIRGGEKVTLIQEHLRYNRILTCKSNKKNVPVTKFSTRTALTSSALSVQMEKNIIGVNIHLFGEKVFVNVFFIFKLLNLEMTSVGMINVIQLMTSKKNPIDLGVYLIGNQREFDNAGDNIASHLKDLGLKLTREASKEESEENDLENLQQFINRSIFPHMNDEKKQENKIYLLALVVARHLEVISDHRPYDDRDDWSNKRLESAGRLFENLFSGMYREAMKMLQRDLINSEDQLATVQTTVSNRLNAMTNNFVSAFSADSWGVNKQGKHNQNITDKFKREATVGSIYHILRINTPAKPSNQVTITRMVQFSQIGYIDPIETPESQQVGLNKSRAITSYITVERPEFVIRRHIDPYVRDYDEEVSESLIILNGKLLGWSNGKELHDYLVSLRRNLTIYWDTAIIYDDQEDILYVHCDAERITRPLFIIDPESGELVYDQLLRMYPDDHSKVSDRMFLLSNGAVEYIDVWENNYITVAQTVSDLRKNVDEIEIVRRHRDDFQSRLTKLEALKKNAKITDNDLRVIRRGEPLIPDSDPEIRTRNATPRQGLDDTITYYKNQIARSELLMASMRIKYTHSEIDPTAIYGVSAALIPLSNHNQGPRNIYQTNMIRQSLGIYHSHHHSRFDTMIKMNPSPTRPLFETQMYSMSGLDTHPAGDNVILAFMIYTGFNQEDAIIFNQASVDNGLFTISKYQPYKMELRNQNDYIEEFCNPQPKKYTKLNEQGIIKVGSSVKAKDILAIVCRRQTAAAMTNRRRDVNKKEIEYQYLKVDIGTEGIVDRVLLTTNEDGRRMLKIKILTVRTPVVGDKFASRSAQKSTVGVLYQRQDMPRTASGIRPDCIINPHAIPSRMTLAKLFELVTSKVGAIRGERINATAFNDFDIHQFMRMLREYGFDSYNEETLYSPITGEPFPAKIFIGTCYYQALRHHVKDKIQARARGPVTYVTNQPTEGRAREGGLRVGEMERDAMISYGAANMAQERLLISSDIVTMYFCLDCQAIATETKYQDQIDLTCPKCIKSNKFGKCAIPTSIKAIIQLIAGTGININFKIARSKSDDPTSVTTARSNIPNVKVYYPVTTVSSKPDPVRPSKK